jgi:hypothetical protein
MLASKLYKDVLNTGARLFEQEIDKKQCLAISGLLWIAAVLQGDVEAQTSWRSKILALAPSCWTRTYAQPAVEGTAPEFETPGFAGPSMVGSWSFKGTLVALQSLTPTPPFLENLKRLISILADSYSESNLAALRTVLESTGGNQKTSTQVDQVDLTGKTTRS